MVNISSLTELKNASDDTIPAVLAKLGYRQSHTLMDVRLLLGYIGVVAAAAAGLYDYQVGFERAKGYTLMGVLTYFICYGGMNAWQYWIEAGTVYVGTKGHTTLTIKTSTNAAKPVYELTLSLASTASGEKSVFKKHELFTKWFDVDGNLVAEPLQTWLSLIVQEVEQRGSKKRQ